jgi:predicted DNA-binding transcriptional regulator AlpA
MAERETFWGTQRLAEFLAVSRSCVERGRRRRPEQWPRATRIGGSVGYLGTDVQAWLADRRVNTVAGTDILLDLSEGLLPRKVVADRLGKSIAWFEKGLAAYPQRLPPGYRVGVRWRYAWPEIVAWLRADRA